MEVRRCLRTSKGWLASWTRIQRVKEMSTHVIHLPLEPIKRLLGTVCTVCRNIVLTVEGWVRTTTTRDLGFGEGDVGGGPGDVAFEAVHVVCKR